MSTPDNSFSKKINGSTKIIISALNPDINENSTIYAINWFNLKRRKLYNFYNWLASPLLKKVGGRVHFKGFNEKKIYGEEVNGRDALLIVEYAGPKAFFQLLSRTYFQLISVLRLSSVKQFNFGFTQRKDEAVDHSEDFSSQYYIAHLFTKSNEQSIDLSSLIDVMSRNNINAHYWGEKAAVVISENKKGNQRQAPFAIDGVVVWKSSDRTAMDEMIKDPKYVDFINQLKSSYIAFFKRVV